MITRLMIMNWRSASGWWTVGKDPEGGWGVARLGELVVPYLCRERDAAKKFNYVQ
jgi:hypothetical protein